MVASQLRFLYYANRGEFAKAAAHREQVELHAAHVGSAWQVETWEAAALLLVYPQIGDIVGAARLAHRLERLGMSVPSFRRYSALARDGILLSRGEPASRPAIARIVAEYDGHTPRSYIGWAGAMGYVARGYNLGGDHAEAKRVCEKALVHVTDADRDYLLHFITLDLELAVADAALGRPDDAMRRIDALLLRHAESGHMLGLGLLHEVRAGIAWAAGQRDAYEESLREVQRCFLPTGEAGLMARCKRLRELGERSSAGEKAATAAITAMRGLTDAERLHSTPEQLAQTAMMGRLGKLA